MCKVVSVSWQLHQVVFALVIIAGFNCKSLRMQCSEWGRALTCGGVNISVVCFKHDISCGFKAVSCILKTICPLEMNVLVLSLCRV
jgi:hypothetical protein